MVIFWSGKHLWFVFWEICAYNLYLYRDKKISLYSTCSSLNLAMTHSFVIVIICKIRSCVYNYVQCTYMCVHVFISSLELERSAIEGTLINKHIVYSCVVVYVLFVGIAPMLCSIV